VLVGVLALPVVLYLIVLLINLRDRPPSEFALRMESTYRNRPAVADSHNAYIYVMGFSVAQDADPYAIGLRRVEWLRNHAEHPEAPDPLQGQEYEPPRAPAIQKIREACGLEYSNCDAALAESDATLLEWLATEGWRLDRYGRLLAMSGWLETIPSDLTATLPAYAPVMEGQRLLLAKVYHFAGEKDPNNTRELLDQDAQFWRGVLASSDILISRMIAVAALTRNFNIGNLALRRLPPDMQLTAMPEAWRTPLTDAELSWLRCFAGEWVFGQSVLGQMAIQNSMPIVVSWEEERGWMSELRDLATVPLFQLQDSGSQRAEMLIGAAEALQVPIEGFPAGLEAANEILAAPEARFGTFANLYNPVGDVLMGIGSSSYGVYPPRLADVEGVRRAAVLATELRSRKIDEQNIEAELAASNLRTPYTGEPFTWDAEQHALVFIGLVPGERGRHALKY
jgi:hypothetical protein